MSDTDHRAEDRGGGEAAPMRWNGWGDPARATELPRAVRVLLPLLLGHLERPGPPVELQAVQLPASRLSEAARAAFAAVVGAQQVEQGAEARLRHAGGRSTPDLLRRRRPVQDAPDAVVRAASHEQVVGCLRAAGAHDVAVIPFGGGTSVVGALQPERGGHHAVISLDVRGMCGLLHLDEVSGQAVFAAGTTGPQAERLLAAHGWELGHYPQSFQYATLGGFAAARSSGQNSAGYGRFDAMVTGLRAATPSGEIDLGRSPGSAAGPDLTRLFLGSEGIFGVITEVRLRVHRRPKRRVLDSWTFADFQTGAEALRRVAQHGGGPTVIRLSDEAETAVSLAQLGRIGKLLARGASAVTLYEGEDLDARRARSSALLREAGGTLAGDGGAQDWLRTRFDGPYLRDALLDAGVFCETLETATTWSELPALRAAVTQALRSGLRAAGARCYVMCHISHLYPTGASLYFTVLAGLHGDPLEPWVRIKAQVNDAIIAAGGTISHHHAVGRDHEPWLAREIGETGVRILRAIKAELDPQGLLNPGAVIAGRSR